jgi:ankyrin repeat protein
LEKTKDVNRVYREGYSSLMWATYNEYDNAKIVKALLDKGADVNFKSSDGSTALSWAQKKGKTATVALLTQAGAK